MFWPFLHLKGKFYIPATTHSQKTVCPSKLDLPQKINRVEFMPPFHKSETEPKGNSCIPQAVAPSPPRPHAGPVTGAQRANGWHTRQRLGMFNRCGTPIDG